jgi:hypothetical protein
MLHPWKCRNGHENVTDVPDAERAGPRRRYVLKCPVPGCNGRSWIFVGSAPSPFPVSVPPASRSRHERSRLS